MLVFILGLKLERSADDKVDIFVIWVIETHL